MAYTERKYDSGKMRRKYERGKGSGGTYGTYEKGTSPSGSDVTLLWKTDTAGYEQLCQMDPLALLIGGVVGGASSLFAGCLSWVTQFRADRPAVVLLLPFGGLLIVFLYQKIGKEDRGTNQVLSTIRSQDEVPLRSAPLIFIATALTHLLGGSAGREGAAIQLGGSIGNQLGRWIHLDEEDRHVIVMCGMSAAFSAVFGTPMAAAVFAMEVVSVGVMYYAALLPCVVASLVAYDFAGSFGIHPENFHVTGIPAFSMENGIKMGIIAVGCGAVSILFCLLLEYVSKGYDKWT